MKPLLSFVTGTLNRRDGFNRMLRSIVERVKVPWELVVSNASNDLYPDVYPPNVKVFHEKPRLGCVKGYNYAFRRARGRWVIWLNDDAEVMPGCDTNAIEFMEHHPKVGLGALYYAENMLPYHVSDYHDMIYANFGIINRELGNYVGWFDDYLMMYGNDNSLTFKVLLAGLGVVGIPRARIWHHAFPDAVRIENMKNQPSDANLLMQHYRHRIEEMRRTYVLFDDLQGPINLSE